MTIEQIPANPANYHKGRSEPYIAVALHNTGGTNINSTINWFQNPAAIVSAHYVVGTDGRIVQMVQLQDTAYHVGIHFAELEGYKNQICQIVKDKWGDNPNNYCIGIECVGLGGSDLTEAQYNSVAYIIKEVIKITVDRYHIVGHFEINPPARPTDAKNFNYQKLINLILNQPTMADPTVKQLMGNLGGSTPPDSSAEYETDKWKNTYGSDYSKWMWAFYDKNAAVKAYFVKTWEDQVASLTSANTELQGLIKEQEATIERQGQTISDLKVEIAELNKACDMKDEQIKTLTQQLSECQAGNQKPSFTINIFGLKILFVRKQ